MHAEDTRNCPTPLHRPFSGNNTELPGIPAYNSGIPIAHMRKWQIIVLIVIVVTAGILGALYYSAKQLAARFEPYIRSQAITYLKDRFQADVELGALRVNVPRFSPWQLWLNKGRGTSAAVEADNVILRRPNGQTLFSIHHLAFHADLGKLFDPVKTVPLVILDGVVITIPPKGQSKAVNQPLTSNVVLEELLITNAKLLILPKDPVHKKPLEFELQRIRLRNAGLHSPMRYEAALRNAKPPGQIDAKGTFGPWDAAEPGDTPLTGDFVFDNADLGVFSAIAGILDSRGSFHGQLAQIYAKGSANIPDFRLKMAGNPVPLQVNYEVEVDGTNGNTILKPIHATLGKTNFTTSGAVIKHDGDTRRSIDLDVLMPNGHLADLLHLAMKGTTPFMAGDFYLNTKIRIPPLDGKVKEKLLLNGRFKVQNGQFFSSQIQDKIDGLSRQAQGQPKNESIDEVFTDLTGSFRMEDQAITFQQLTFAIPGALMELDGSYDIVAEQLDFRGTARLRAKVSQTQTGWKRWALKPVDPFFSKKGAGTFVKIKIDGTRKEPHFGLDRGKSKPQ